MVAQKAMGVSSAAGVLMLMGIVARNSVLLVEYAIAAQHARADCVPALVGTVRKRARSIVTATIAMFAGMAHVAAGIGAASGFRAPMVIVVIGGLPTFTPLGLVFASAAYSYMDSLGCCLGRRRSCDAGARVTSDDRGADLGAILAVGEGPGA